MSDSLESLHALYAELVEHCDLTERALLREKIVIPDVIDAQRPGGADNPDMSPSGWYRFSRWLERTHALGTRSGRAAGSGEARPDVEAAMSAALAEAPESVQCSDGETRYVYPKALWSLQWLALLNEQATIMLGCTLEARRLEVIEDLSVLHLAPLVRAVPLLLYAWILTHKGPGLPFDDDAPLTDPPEWTKTLDADDFYKIAQAHRRVNGIRLNLISTFLERDGSAGSGGPAFSVSGFVGAIAGEMEPNAGRDMMRKVSLGQIFATRVASAAASRESMRRAKADADRGGA
jgi:hypothetical protein